MIPYYILVCRLLVVSLFTRTVQLAPGESSAGAINAEMRKRGNEVEVGL